jgi:hypothetical protein
MRSMIVAESVKKYLILVDCGDENKNFQIAVSYLPYNIDIRIVCISSLILMTSIVEI